MYQGSNIMDLEGASIPTSLNARGIRMHRQPPLQHSKTAASAAMPCCCDMVRQSAAAVARVGTHVQISKPGASPE